MKNTRTRIGSLFIVLLFIVSLFMFILTACNQGRTVTTLPIWMVEHWDLEEAVESSLQYSTITIDGRKSVFTSFELDGIKVLRGYNWTEYVLRRDTPELFPEPLITMEEAAQIALDRFFEDIVYIETLNSDDLVLVISLSDIGWSANLFFQDELSEESSTLSTFPITIDATTGEVSFNHWMFSQLHDIDNHESLLSTLPEWVIDRFHIRKTNHPGLFSMNLTGLSEDSSMIELSEFDGVPVLIRVHDSDIFNRFTQPWIITEQIVTMEDALRIGVEQLISDYELEGLTTENHVINISLMNQEWWMSISYIDEHNKISNTDGFMVDSVTRETAHSPWFYESQSTDE